MSQQPQKPSALARMMINMWNNHFSLKIYQDRDGKEYRLNFLKLFDWSPITRNSNKKMGIKEYKAPSLNVTFPAADGNKTAASIWLNDVPSNKWVVGIHGFNSSRFGVLYLTWHYRKLGYNILTFDLRNHGESQRDVVSWGYKEKYDLIGAINWLTKAYTIDHIGLVGTSLGGFTLNYFMLTEPELAKKANIRWGVADSAYMSAPKLLKKMITDNFPDFFEGTATETLKSMMQIYKNEYGADLSVLDFSNLIQVDQKAFPILYVHNRKDKVTDYLDSFRMWNEKNNIEKTDANELKIFEGKHHTKSLIEFKKSYLKVTTDFVKKNGEPKKENH